MSVADNFSNIKLFAFLARTWRRRAIAGAADAEQNYLAAAADHQDLERRLKVLECRHGSVLHTLRVMKVGAY